MNIIGESKRFGDFSEEEQSQMYNIFKQSYEKATGSSWDERKFYSRANDWLFYGDVTGFVTVRPQKSGYYKLVGIAGNIKSALNGLHELNSMNYPVWGMMTPELANILIKRYGYRAPNKIESLIISKQMPLMFGSKDYKRNPDGSVTFNYPDVGESTKVFVGNDQYYKKARKEITQYILGKKKISESIIDDSDSDENDLNISLDEKRAIPRKKYIESNFDTIKKYFEKYGYEDTYLSFRSGEYTTIINPNTTFNTPVGYYCYPMKNYETAFKQVNDIKEMMQSGRVFPWIPDNSNYIHLFNLKKKENVIFSLNIDVPKIHEFVRKIESIYGSNSSVKKLCEDYFTGDNYHSEILKNHNKPNKFKNEFQKIWLFIYDIAASLNYDGYYYFDRVSRGIFKYEVKQYAIVCNRIGINGFVDDGCAGIIHLNEPCQAVFFKLRTLRENEKFIPTNSNTLYHSPLYINKEIPDVTDVLKEKYLKALEKMFGTNQISILDKNYRQLLQINSPILIKVDDVPIFINAGGKKNAENINLDVIDKDERFELINSKARAGYFNTMFKTQYDMVKEFNLKTGLAIASTIYGKSVFINKKGQLDTTGIDVEKLSDYNERAYYYNQKYGTNYTRVKEFENYGETISDNPDDKRAFADYGINGFVFINKEGKPDISNVDISKLNENCYYIFAYLNQKFGKNFADMDEMYLDKDTVLADGAFVSLLTGEPDATKISPFDIEDTKYLSIYFNQRYGTKYKHVARFKNKHAIATNMNDNQFFINEKGEPDIDGIVLNGLINYELRIYLSQKFKNVDIFQVSEIGKYGENMVLVTDYGNDKYFMNVITGEETSIKDYEPTNNNFIDNKHRVDYLNKKLGTNFTNIVKLQFTDNIFYATEENGDHVFINSEGNADINFKTLDDLQSSDMRKTYLNQLNGTGGNYDDIENFNGWGDNITLAYKNEIPIIINNEGTPYVPEYDDFNGELEDSTKLYTAYINQKYDKNFKFIDSFYEDIAIATMVDGKKIFINKEGEPDTKGVDINDYAGPNLATYFNQKNGTNYNSIEHENGLLYDQNNNKITIINAEGIPSTENIDPSDIENKYVRAAYFNQKYGTDFILVREYGDNELLAISNNDVPIFINYEGEPIVPDIKFNDITSGIKRAAYINSKSGTNYSSVSDSIEDLISKDGEHIYLVDVGYNIFITDSGTPTINIDDKDINKLPAYKTYYKNTVIYIDSLKEKENLKETKKYIQLLINQEINNLI
jgi:hypothetical protein